MEKVDPDRPFAILRFSRQGEELNDAIYRLGEPVRYEYIHKPWDLDYYQTLYGSVPGSVEMPSAGRAFSWELLFKLRRKGIRVAFIVLHTGLSYPLEDRWQLPPQENWEAFAVPEETVEIIRRAQSHGNRVIAAGTTVVRALESAVDTGGLTPRSGWTNLYIDEKFSPRVVDGWITGFHEPEASHLDLLTAFVDRLLLYREAIRLGYLWHEFGDAHLIL